MKKKIYFLIIALFLFLFLIALAFFGFKYNNISESPFFGKSITGFIIGSFDENDSRLIGYEFLDLNGNVTNASSGEVVHMWNTQDDYFFNKSSGIQFTNHFQDYWTRNIFCIGYYSGEEWIKIKCADELENFNRDIQTDNSTYVNATLWKDFTYGGYNIRLGVRYSLKLDDKNLSVIIYGKNIDTKDIPYELGFAWKVSDFEIPSNQGNDRIFLNGTNYDLNGTYDLLFKNMTNKGKPMPFFRAYDYTEFLRLDWNENLNYAVKMHGDGNQSNFYVALLINAGYFNAGQEKSATMYWIDAVGDLYTVYAPLYGSWDITGDGTYLWFSHEYSNYLYKYYMNWTYAGSYIDVSGQTTSASGVAYYGGYFYVYCYSDNYVYKYWYNGTYTGVGFDTSAYGNEAPGGMATDGTYIWLSDEDDDVIYKYWLNGTYINYFTPDAGSGDIEGVAYYNNFLWIVDTYDEAVYKYYKNGTYAEFYFYLDVDNLNSLGIHTNGAYFWIYDWYENWIFVYVGPGVAGDSTPPSVTLNEPADYANYSSPKTELFNCTVFDNVNLSNVTFYWNVSGWAANGTNSSGINNTKYQFSRSITSEGTFLWNCYACDNSSNCAFASANRTFSYRQDPNITINSPTNITYNTTSITFNITATSSGYSVDVCQYSLDSATNVSMAHSLLYKEGDYTGNHFDVEVGNVGITQNGTFFWLSNYAIGEVYKYYMNGTYTGDHFNTAGNGNAVPEGIDQNGTFFWTTDLDDGEVYKYWMNGTYTGDHFDTGVSGNNRSAGITQNGTFFWITDDYGSTDKVYKYWMNGTYTGFKFNTVGWNNNPYGITQNGTYFWITSLSNTEVYKHYMNGTYTGEHFDTAGSGNTYLEGITQNGTYFWTTDVLGSEVYEYAMTNIYSDFWTKTLTVSHGSHTVVFYCNNTNGNWNNKQISFSVNTCTYESGNWIVDCSAYCNITSNINVGGNNISITGKGVFTTTANISNYKKLFIQGADASNICTVRCLNGGCFKT